MSGAAADSRKQADLADTLNSIMVAQLTLIGSHLDLQGMTLAHHPNYRTALKPPTH
jgi:hypothetical protein